MFFLLYKANPFAVFRRSFVYNAMDVTKILVLLLPPDLQIFSLYLLLPIIANFLPLPTPSHNCFKAQQWQQLKQNTIFFQNPIPMNIVDSSHSNFFLCLLFIAWLLARVNYILPFSFHYFVIFAPLCSFSPCYSFKICSSQITYDVGSQCRLSSLSASWFIKCSPLYFLNIIWLYSIYLYTYPYACLYVGLYIHINTHIPPFPLLLSFPNYFTSYSDYCKSHKQKNIEAVLKLLKDIVEAIFELKNREINA